MHQTLLAPRPAIHRLLLLSSMIALGLLSGCTTRQAYDNIQADQQRQCAKLPEIHRKECLGRLSTPFEDYDRERRALEQEGVDRL